MDRAQLQAWVAGYGRAWRASGTEGLGELFAPDAGYRMAPFDPPHEGLAAIRELWEAERLGPDEVFELDTEIVAVEGDTGVVRAEVRYGDPDPRTYRDLWIVTLAPDGRCTRFEEWPFSPPD